MNASLHFEVPGLGDQFLSVPSLYLANAVAAALSKGMDTVVDVIMAATVTHRFVDGQFVPVASVQ